MFLEHFGLAVNPFGMSPRLDFLYKSSAFEESMAHLDYGLDHGEAIILITGPIGSGKTMSLQSFLANLDNKHLSALVTNTQVSTAELLKLILEDLGLNMGPGWDKSDLLIAFKDYLLKAGREGRKVVVVIDEAQNLSMDVLEEVRLLTNLGQGVEQPVQLILAGQPELKEIVNRPELAQLRQRIRVHYEVEALDFEEMVGYVNHRMAVAGCSREVFEPRALEKLFEISDGIPRLVNTHAGDALLSAFVAQRSRVSLRDMEEGVKGGGAEVEKSPDVAEYVGSTGSSRTGSGRSDSGRRRFWTTLAAVGVLALVVWYTMIRVEHPTTVTETPLIPPVHSSAGVDSVLVARGSVEESKPDSLPSKDLDPVVEAEPVTPAPKPADYYYFAHVASFRDSVRAHVYLGQLEGRSFPAQVEKQLINDREWNRVYIGPMATQDAAESMAKRLRETDGAGYYQVVRRSSDGGT